MVANQDGDLAGRREIRLALVLNGGVSLAVWMGGVTAEIDRMRRAAYPGLTTGEDGSDETFACWQRLLGLFRARLIVDVIAGASAGGLNGAVLATSIARAKPLESLRPVWIEVGSAEGLAANTDQPEGYHRRSLLDGDMFTAEIKKVFQRITDDAADRPAHGPVSAAALRSALEAEAVRPRSVTLYTTATSLHGKGETFRDSTGQQFTQVEYRVVCTFKRPLVGTDDFAVEREGTPSGQSTLELVRAARASASFPAAFEPTFFSAGEPEVTTAGADPDAQVSMKDVAGIPHARWMIDGGVLDNEPFGPVLDRIAQRAVIGDVDRVIAYITPEDSGDPSDPDEFGADHMPGIIATVSGAMGLPREANLLNELDRIVEMRREAQSHLKTGLLLLGQALSGTALRAAAELLAPVYWESRRAAIIHDVRSRTMAAGEAPTVTATSAPAAATQSDSGATPAAGRTEWGMAANERVLRLALSVARDAASARPENAKAVADALLEISAALLQLSELESKVDHAIAAAIPPARAVTIGDSDILRVVDEVFADLEVPQAVDGLVATALGKLAEAGLTESHSVEDFRQACLDVEVVRRAAAPIGAGRHSPPFRFSRFGANIGSPYVNGGDPIPEKLMGLRLHHFGGFLDPAWREYDWMWGRLDGASHLVAMLIPLLRDTKAFPAVPADLLAWDDASAGDAELRLEGLVARLRALPPDAPTPPELTTKLTLRLVGPLHRAILRDELWEAGRTDGPPLDPESDAEIRAALANRTKGVNSKTIPAMCETDKGMQVIDELVCTGLEALASDPGLHVKQLSSLLKGVAGFIRVTSKTTLGRGLEHLALRIFDRKSGPG